MKLHEIAIFTTNVDAVARFYEQLLGCPPVHRGEGIAIFRAEGVTILVHQTYLAGPGDLPCENHTAFAVHDLTAAVAELEAGGVKLEYPPHDYDWGRSAYLRDPDGRLLELHEVK